MATRMTGEGRRPAKRIVLVDGFLGASIEAVSRAAGITRALNRLGR